MQPVNIFFFYLSALAYVHKSGSLQAGMYFDYPVAIITKY